MPTLKEEHVLICQSCKHPLAPQAGQDKCPNCDQDPWKKPVSEELIGVPVRTSKYRPKTSIIGR